jgi:phosphotriesterase-related protein
MVLSHDAACFMDYFGGAWEDVLAQAAPNWRYGHIHDDVLPALREKGVTDDQVDQMLVANPRRYFS